MSQEMAPYIFNTTCVDRNKLNNHRSFLVLLTGLSGSGKSTIASTLESKLHKEGIRTYVLDGDNLRNGINSDLTFSIQDRKENMRRIGEISNLMIDAGIVVFASFIAPFNEDRLVIKNIVGKENYIEVYVNTSLTACEKRDVKGLYRKARRGEIKNMTGIDSPYEAPETPDLIIDTETIALQKNVDKVFTYILPKLKCNNE